MDDDILKNLLCDCLCKDGLFLDLGYYRSEEIQEEIINMSDEERKAYNKYHEEHFDEIHEAFEEDCRTIKRFNNLELKEKAKIIKYYQEQGLPIVLRPHRLRPKRR